jgi:hypothetical protein
MRIFLIGMSLLITTLTFGLRLILIMSYSSYDELIRKTDVLLESNNSTERIIAKFLKVLITHRLIIGTAGFLVFLFSLILK